MAIRGFYKTVPPSSPAPYVRAQIRLPRLDIEAGIEFFIDTGADFTLIHPWDARILGLSPGLTLPGNNAMLAGIGGALEYHTEDATLRFDDEDGSYLYFFCQIYVTFDQAVEGMPSILGRNFLNQCSLLADYPENRALITPANVINGVILPS